MKIMSAIKTKGRVKGMNVTHQHAEAMVIEELTYVMEWSELQCPAVLIGPSESAAAYCSQGTKQLVNVAKHALMRAFMSTGFTLWTRCVPETARRDS